jgi:hypothetical protein
MVRVSLVKGLGQRSGWLDLRDAGIEICPPRRGRPAWAVPREDVTWVDTQLHHPSGNDPTQVAPAIVPRIEVLRRRSDVPTSALLVFHRPRQVPLRRGKQRWTDAVALSLREKDVPLLRSAGLQIRRSLDEALVAAYGTVESPSIPGGELQFGWQVYGQALSKPGPYSKDPRPVARTAAGPDSRRLALAILAGAGAAVATGLAGGAVGYYTGHVGLVALGVGVAVGWAAHRAARAAHRQRVLGVAAAVLAFLGLMSAGSSWSCATSPTSSVRISLQRYV